MERKCQKRLGEKIGKTLKGRFAGENNPVSRLTLEDVEEIVRLREKKFFTHKKIAEIFGVFIVHVKRILSGDRWNKRL